MPRHCLRLAAPFLAALLLAARGPSAKLDKLDPSAVVLALRRGRFR